MTNIQFFVLDKSILGCNFCFEVHYHLLLVIVRYIGRPRKGLVMAIFGKLLPM